METIKEIISTIGEVIDLIGVTILLYGFVKIFIKYTITEFVKKPFKTPIRSLQKLRCEIGIYILLALDLLITSDIIHTIMDITQEQLIELAIMIVLRTGIGFFLGKEVEELHD
ncbi:DUF1622 domain-containing protein [Flagellimonas sp. 2504JD4-2]